MVVLTLMKLNKDLQRSVAVLYGANEKEEGV